MEFLFIIFGSGCRLISSLIVAVKIGVIAFTIIKFFESRFGAPIEKYLPTPFWIYLAAILGGTFGFLPAQSPVYFFIERRVLPATLVMMLIGTPLHQLLKMGGKALQAMAIAAGTMMVAVFVSYGLMARFLPEESWKGCGALLGTWIGGSANMLAVKQILNLSEDGFAPLIVIDTILSYTWLALLLAGARYQEMFDRPFKSESENIVSNDALNVSVSTEKKISRPIQILLMLAAAFGVAELMVHVGAALNGALTFLTASGWTLLMTSIASLALASTPLKKLEKWGASKTGGTLLYIVLVSIGAKTNLFSVQGVPIYLLFGVVVLLIHGIMTLLLGRWMRVPLFLLSTASQANVGGAVSAPIVSTAYRLGTANIAVLMAILGAVGGTYLGLVGAWVCHALRAFLV